MFKYLYCGGDTAQNPKTGDWGAGWLDPSFKLIDGTECGKKKFHIKVGILHKKFVQMFIL